jgi:hypothetical protein
VPYSETVEGAITEIASCTPVPLEADELEDLDKIPATLIPGLPKKLSRFSRATARGQQFFTDKQVLGCLVREGKANQKRVDDWKAYIAKQGDQFFSPTFISHINSG